MSHLYSVLRKKSYEKNVLQFTKLFIEIRNISFRNQILNKNFYDSLGITPKATQNEIKSAYYKLSMLYHPDKNKDSDVAADKFRDISEAYEVLGNFKLRRLYDKGIIHTADYKYTQHAEEPVEDDAQTKFYKQHMRKSTAPPVSGRTPIYDFDEWSRNHYGTAFERRQSAKLRYNEAQGKMSTDKLKRETIYLIFSLSLLITMFIIAIYSDTQYDNPKQQSSGTRR